VVAVVDKTETAMSNRNRIVIIALLALAVGGVLVVKRNKANTPPTARPVPAGEETTPLPRLVDLGSHGCTPCKAMAPILDALEKEFAGRFEVEFIDVKQVEGAAEKYGVRIIPVQIFYDADGKERFRHEGFYSREDILATWENLGIDVTKKPEA